MADKCFDHDHICRVTSIVTYFFCFVARNPDLDEDVEQEAEHVDEPGGVAELVVWGRVQVRAGVEVKRLSTWKRKIFKKIYNQLIS